jgi:hypothetical protein
MQEPPLIRIAVFATGALVALSGPLDAAASCNQTVGPAQARRYVDQCRQVSPATHPPCNAANACRLIRNEIRRGCALLGKDAPSFCQSAPARSRPYDWPRSN